MIARMFSASGPTMLAPWLVAVAATTALAIVLAGAPGGRTVAAPAHARAAQTALPAKAQASTVEAMFRRMTPYAVQPDVGPSGGKAATCSIYSDGNLDNGTKVTWAVTLCVVNPLGRLAG